MVADPACGGGCLLLAAAEQLAADGLAPAAIVAHHLVGIEIDPAAAAVARQVLSEWCGGAATPRIVVADALRLDLHRWPAVPDVVVANPPFLGQLRVRTARPAGVPGGGPVGDVSTAYTDAAALFSVLCARALRPGGRAAVLVPTSLLASRDAAPTRGAVEAVAELRSVTAVDRADFAEVDLDLCLLLLAARAAPATDGSGPVGPTSWAARLLDDLPAVDRGTWTVSGTVGDQAAVYAGFRDAYYRLVPLVAEADAWPDAALPRLVTSGAIDPPGTDRRHRPVRFAKRRWVDPVVDLSAADAATTAWARSQLVPKVVVASQTRVVEAAVDAEGCWLPVPPVVSVVPHAAGELWAIAAVLLAPPVAAAARGELAGTGLSRGRVRLPAPWLRALPLPADDAAWAEGADALRAGDVAAMGVAMTASYGLAPPETQALVAWWRAESEGRGSAQ